MRLINQSVEEWYCGYTLPEIWAHIARCARVCYQSTPRSNGETEEEFVKRVILRGYSLEDIGKSRELQLKLHLSVLEHGTVYLDIPNNVRTLEFLDFFRNNNKYSKTYQHGNLRRNSVAVTTNMRVIVENNLMSCLTYLCAPTEYHSLRTTCSIITDIGVARELARHRTHSISEESTRYCNYSKDKFNNELTFIIPDWIDIPNCEVNSKNAYKLEITSNRNNNFAYKLDVYYFIHELLRIEKTYINLIKSQSPQQRRQILPLSTKVQTIHTAFNSDWNEFVKLRADACSGSVHPNMKVIANKIKCLMAKENA